MTMNRTNPTKVVGDDVTRDEAEGQKTPQYTVETVDKHGLNYDRIMKVFKGEAMLGWVVQDGGRFWSYTRHPQEGLDWDGTGPSDLQANDLETAVRLLDMGEKTPGPASSACESSVKDELLDPITHEKHNDFLKQLRAAFRAGSGAAEPEPNAARDGSITRSGRG